MMRSLLIFQQSWSALIITRLPMSARNVRKQKIPNSSRMKEPPALIPGSYVSPELAAHVMYDKYVMSMPLYRHEKDYTHPAVQWLSAVKLAF